MKKLTVAIMLGLTTLTASPLVMAATTTTPATNNTAKTVKVNFAKGASSASYYGQLKGNTYDSYHFVAKKGQKINVNLTGGNVDAYLFNKNLADSVNMGKYSPELDKNGLYTLPYSGSYELRILQPRSQANQGKSPKYWLEIGIR